MYAPENAGRAPQKEPGHDPYGLRRPRR